MMLWTTNSCIGMNQGKRNTDMILLLRIIQVSSPRIRMLHIRYIGGMWLTDNRLLTFRSVFDVAFKLLQSWCWFAIFIHIAVDWETIRYEYLFLRTILFYLTISIYKCLSWIYFRMKIFGKTTLLCFLFNYLYYIV